LVGRAVRFHGMRAARSSAARAPPHRGERLTRDANHRLGGQTGSARQRHRRFGVPYPHVLPRARQCRQGAGIARGDARWPRSTRRHLLLRYLVSLSSFGLRHHAARRRRGRARCARRELTLPSEAEKETSRRRIVDASRVLSKEVTILARGTAPAESDDVDDLDQVVDGRRPGVSL